MVRFDSENENDGELKKLVGRNVKVGESVVVRDIRLVKNSFDNDQPIAKIGKGHQEKFLPPHRLLVKGLIHFGIQRGAPETGEGKAFRIERLTSGNKKEAAAWDIEPIEIEV